MSEPTPDSRATAAAAIRALGEAFVEHVPSPELDAEIVAEVERLRQRILAAPAFQRDHVAFGQRIGRATLPGDALSHFDECFVDGRHNPFALHSEFHRTEDEVRASITFTKPYEGPTGRVHGGAIAACYEDVIGYHLTLHRGVGYMAKLSIEFLRGTPLNEPVAFSSAVVSRGEGTMLVEGTSMANGKVTTRCVGEVVIVSGERFTPFRSDIARGEAPCRSEAPEAG